MDPELRILIVDDNHADAELEIRELRRAGLRVEHRVVQSEDSFRQALQRFQPEVIISDFSMPKFDGMLALSIARSVAQDTPFIFVSGTLGEEYAIRALNNGATDYVLKTNLVRLPPAVDRAVREVRAVRERKRSEAWLHLQAAALDAAVNAILITDRDGTILWVNRAFCALTGYSAEEAIGCSPRLLKSGLHGPEFYRRIFETVLAGSVWQGEVVNRYKDGRLATEEMTITPVRDTSGEITHFIAIKQDVTARKEAERNRERLSAIVEASPDFIATTDPNRRIRYMNSAARRLLELPANVDPSEVHIDDTHPRWAADLVLKTGIPAAIRDGIWSGETTFLTRSGREIPVNQVILAHRKADGHLEFLSTIARDISERKDYELRINRLNQILSVLSGINAAIVRIRDRRALLEETCRIISTEGKFELVWIATIDAEEQKVEPIVWAGFSDEEARSMTWAGIGAARGTMREAIATRTLAMRTDVERQLGGGRLAQAAVRYGCRSAVTLPLVVGERVTAVISIFATGRDSFDEDELRLLEELMGDVSFALDHIAKEEKLDYLAFYDALTGLPNRSLFIDRVGQQMRTRGGESLMTALILLNIERFRNVNETFGRHGGDELIRAVAQRLTSAFRGKDYLAHVGGDSFGVTVRGMRDTEAVLRVVNERIFACFKEPFEVDGSELPVSVRAGIALYPGDGADAETLFRNAEAALDRTRKSGDRHLFYAPEMNARAAAQLKIEAALRRAILEEQFVLHYQPRVDLATRRVAGLEALIRWAHPEQGLVPPGEFISVLESTGLILEVGRWVLKRAAFDHALWRAAGLNPPRIAVNVSVVQLRQRDFVEDLKAAIPEASGCREHMEIEITESMLMEDFEGNVGKLKAIRELGFQVAIDDFGTGYSSLGYLARLPVDLLKIDRSFITMLPSSPEQTAIVSAVVSLGRALNLRIVAEGVETEEQANLLRLLRCDEAQGYLFSKPVPGEELQRILGQ